uniref:Uncharacterized protein n=1 Tax=Lotus japonicus TaxID=34305 RepID=I3T5C9_LOTJA|nr:unknown [Lotus japonicus]
MIPRECRHSIARAISSAKPMATCVSKHLGRMFSKYLRNVPPNNNSVTITITGYLQAPINFTKFLCCTLDNIATSLAKRPSLLTMSSAVSPFCTILIATVWFLYFPP